MWETKNLENIEAVKKIKEFAEKTGTCIFCTHTNEWMFTRPMSCRDVDEEWKIYFFSQKNSAKNKQLKQNPKANLIISNTWNLKFMDIAWEVEITEDRNVIDQHWNEFLRAWFESKDDPEISVLIFTPSEGHYWETQDWKIVSLLKMAKAAITKNPTDDEWWREWEINL